MGPRPGGLSFLVAVATLAAGGCFSPEIPEGLLCGEENLCPPGFACVSGTCARDPSGDASDVGPDSSTACALWSPSPSHFDPCAIPAAGPPLQLDQGIGHVLDTDLGLLIDDGGNSRELVKSEITSSGFPDAALIVSVESFTLGPDDRLRVEGTRPLILASWGDVTIDGELIASGLPDVAPAGANSASCSTPGPGTAGGGGGGGGGFAEVGGSGGIGCNTCPIAKLGGSGGNPAAVPSFPRGGCGGGAGGTQPRGGVGGNGGGAIQLTARTSIRIRGRIDVGGAGGLGAGSDAGGGGGGSGGYLGIEAPAIAVAMTAAIAANGGGGGGGADVGQTGLSGDAGQLSPQQAPGGNRGGAGGDGGDGGASAGDAQPGTNSNTGGGGGGGGSPGFILLRGPANLDTAAMVSPAPVIAN